MHRLAVLTGDIVASTDLNSMVLNQAIDEITRASEDMAGWPTASQRVGFARRAGDGWQIAFEASQFAFRAALYVRAGLAGLDPQISTRIAISVGDGSFPDTNQRDLNHAIGPAFTASGRALEHMPRGVTLACADTSTIGAVARLLDALSESWTTVQARTIALALDLPTKTQAQIAESLGVSRQSVAQTLKSAHFPAIRDALDMIEETENAS